MGAAQRRTELFFSLWTFGGSVFVLFLNEPGLPKGRIGFVLSVFPFCGLIALVFAPVAARLGRKRVFLAGYGLRKPVMALLLMLPWVTASFGQVTAIGFLSAVIIVFAVLRALAETAVYPWMQEFIPNRLRGRFAAWSAVTGLVASAIALFIAGKVLAVFSGFTGYMWLIGAGAVLV
jgi:MFS family permease